MKALYSFITAFVLNIFFVPLGHAQTEWPKALTSSNGDLIKIYQWQPQAFADGVLQANAAISVIPKGKQDPVFGMIWLNANAATNGNQIAVQSVNVNAIKLPDDIDNTLLEGLKSDLSAGMSNWNLSIPSADVNTMLQQNQDQTKLASSYNNNPPQIIYADRPSLLVVIDGSPKLQRNNQWNADVVVNTPFNIVKINGKFFLYGGKHWYMADAVTGPYDITTNVPSNLKSIEASIAQANKENNAQQEETAYVIYNIIVSTQPAELLQSNGEPNFTPIAQTNLLYVKNSDNDIFMDVTGQQYYVLLSGRWYRSSTLKGKWQYVAADKLPADFAKIPEGSPKDNVLTSVAGTAAAQDAVMEAQVPQTAKVDRRSASATIQYDGNPQFEDIDGTDMAYAVNTQGQVLRWRGGYYAVDNGVWFRASNPMGPWIVSVDRPYSVAYIPPSYPVYGMKYVYVYDVTPDYIYMGYTPGYLNTYVYGPTVVYGTGYYYRPWYGSHYYARPYTWGFNMHYNPWTGWGFGFNYGVGWFNGGWGGYNTWGWGGGWWGPTVYRPAYCWTPYSAGYRHGYYGNYRNNTVIINNNINVYRNNNIYNNRTGVVTRDNRRAVTYANTPVRRMDNGNARPSRNFGDNPRPTVNRDVRGGSRDGLSPRTSNGNGVGRNDGNLNNGRPSRTFDRGNNGNGNTVDRDQTPVRRNTDGNTASPPRQFADGTRPEGRQQRSAGDNIQRSERSFPSAPTQRSNPAPQVNRQQPVQRSFQPSAQPSRSNVSPRVERSAPAPSRSAGGGEHRGRRE